MTATTDAITPIVKIDQITKRIGSKTIIDKLSFEVPRGFSVLTERGKRQPSG